jgi:hypothetical protein
LNGTKKDRKTPWNKKVSLSLHLKVYFAKIQSFPLWWFAKLAKLSPELRQARVLLPERFTIFVCSFGARHFCSRVSPLAIIRSYFLYEWTYCM